ncbi:hypothetical protein, partial [Enterococcus casseliflavus]|uniref:hypothetical protein n=1 Tax=Enterococcus casseliflavus TaxID=37734 RepID=UPI003D0B1B2F
VLFAGETNILGWLDQARRARVELQRWRFEGTDPSAAFAELDLETVLPIVLRRRGALELVSSRTVPQVGSELSLAMA